MKTLALTSPMMRGTLARGFEVARDALGCSGIVSQEPYGTVAEVAEQSSDASGVVAVVDGQAPTVLIHAPARGAHAVLSSEKAVVLGDGHAVSAAEPCCSRPRLALLGVRGKPSLMCLQTPLTDSGVTRVLLALRIALAGPTPTLNATRAWAGLEDRELVERQVTAASRTGLHTNS